MRMVTERKFTTSFWHKLAMQIFVQKKPWNGSAIVMSPESVTSVAYWHGNGTGMCTCILSVSPVCYASHIRSGHHHPSPDDDLIPIVMPSILKPKLRNLLPNRHPIMQGYDRFVMNCSLSAHRTVSRDDFSILSTSWWKNWLDEFPWQPYWHSSPVVPKYSETAKLAISQVTQQLPLRWEAAEGLTLLATSFRASSPPSSIRGLRL